MIACVAAGAILADEEVPTTPANCVCRVAEMMGSPTRRTEGLLEKRSAS